MNDLKFAARQLLKNPGFSAAAILTLALGIGANTAIFSVLDRLLGRPLPVERPDQLVLFGTEFDHGQGLIALNYPLFKDYQRENNVLSHLSAVADLAVGLGIGDATERQNALLVSGNYFDLLGLQAALGRTFAPNEGSEPDDAQVAVLSHGLWQRAYAADPAAIGKTLTVNGHTFTVIGVAPREFGGTTRGQSPDLYLPITAYATLTGERPGGDHPLATRFFTWHLAMGRLKPGITRPQAQAALQTIAAKLNADGLPNTTTNLLLFPGAAGFTENLQQARTPLRLLFATAAFVLLIACANLANLQLARATSRLREFAVRLALGASRARLIRTLLAESLLLALIGGALAVFLADALTHAIQQFRPADASFELAGGIDLRVLAFALLTSIATGVLFGLAPAWRASRPELLPELKGAPAPAHPTRVRWNNRNALVILQVALSMVVLVCATLCARSLQKLEKLDPGFRPAQLVLMSFDLALNNYSDPAAAGFYRQLLDRARALPGVESASLGWNTPLAGRTPGMSLERVEGYQPRPNEHPWADVNFIAADYFRTLGSTILHGREFDDSDTETSPRVVVINEAFAKSYLPDVHPVGKHLFLHGPNGPNGQPVPAQIVGVVRTSPNRNLTDAPRQLMYFPATQRSSRDFTLLVRTGLNPSVTIAALREAVKSIDPKVPAFRVRTMEQQRAGSLSIQRLTAALLAAFGLLSLLLAALGIYSVLAYSVSRRTREIGIRMALGARVGAVLHLILRQGLTLIAVGIASGLAGAALLTRSLRSLLHGVDPWDPASYTAVGALLAAVGVLACWLPARRATRVHPSDALRQD